MAFDATTESIAHFIGAFQLAQEEARLRAEYDRIRAEEAAEQEAAQIELNVARLKAPHELEGVTPALDYVAPTTAITSQAPAMELSPPDPSPETAGRPVPAALEAPAPQAAPAPAPGPDAARAEFHIPPPSSLIAVASQTAILSDDDTFGIAGAGFAPIAPMTEALVRMADLAEALSPVRLDLGAASDDWFGALDALRQALPEEGRSGGDGALQISVATGMGATGDVLADGLRLDALPDWTEFRPAIFAEDEDEDEDEEAADEAAHDFAKDFGDNDAAPVAAGHAVVTGANSAVNDAGLVSNWLDAPVIAVAGSVLRLDAISQVNVLVDHDSAPLGAASAPSTATNVAQIVTTARDGSAKGAGTTSDGPPDIPDNWAVVRIEGDVTQVNWVDQYSFVTDHDRAEVSFSGSNTYLGLGGNDVLNDVSLWELGFTYDLIMVGGDMIDASIINQVNVLLDSDRVEIGGAGGPASAHPVSAHPAGAGPAGAGPAGVAAPAPLGTAEGGTATKGAETAGLPQAEAPGAKPVAADPAAPADPDASPGGISTGDNLLWNQARIETVGEDASAPLGAAFARTLERLADGAETIGDDVAANPLFDGIELLRVLYIKGDFVTVDQISQTNVLGDADQVHLARERFLDDLHDQITATTGSNLMANFAEITDTGVDSTVMAGGDVYSDALIHQAELIETGPDIGPDGPGGIAALTNEAVAFLADDMMDMPSAGGIAATVHGQIAETAGQSDVMQTVLA